MTIGTKVLRPLQGSHDEAISVSVVDVTVYALILLMGTFQLTHYPHTADFMNDASYPDLARSILEHGSYQLRFIPQTTLPPGFAMILAAVGSLFGLSPATLFPVVAVSTTLGLIATYQFLRLVEGRGVAAAATLLLASSPVLFFFNTTFIYPEMSYFLMSMLTLLLALKIDRAERSKFLVVWAALLSVTLALAVLIRSVGVALLAGLATWVIISLLIVPETGWRRVRRFLIPLVLGSVAQVAWMTWAHRHETLEWQLPGYPESYIAQLKVKDGNYPELGTAKLSDIPRRIGRNVVVRAAGFLQLLTRRNVSRFWSSPAVGGLLLVIAIGLVSSLRNGGQLHDWYFLWHEFIFILWPWNYGDRFVIPVVPLACLYLWRGVKATINYSIRQPRAAGVSLAMVGSVLCISSAAFAFGAATFPANPEHLRGDHLQTIAATLLWGVLTLIGFVTLKSDSLQHLLHRANALPFARRIGGFPVALRLVAIVVIGAMVVSGIKNVVTFGRYNVNPDITEQSGYPMIKAAVWIRTHEPPNRVIMARDSEFIFHFTYRRVVWFPPISDPNVLIEGIRRHHVGVVLVVHHVQNYWLPAEVACFQSLLQTYPNAFHLVHQDLDTWVYEVVSQPGEAVGQKQTVASGGRVTKQTEL